MPVKIFQTENMEAALRTMQERNHHTLVLHTYKSLKPVRLRTNSFLDLDRFEVCPSWLPFADATLARWQKKGGVILYRPRPDTFMFETPPSDATLFIETPLQYDRFEYAIQYTRQEVVLYRPPSWRTLDETVDQQHPTKDTYVVLEAVFKALVGRDLTPDMEGALRASNFPPETTAVFTAHDIEQLTEWSETRLKFAMRYRYKFHSIRYHAYRTSIPPDNDELEYFYDILRKQPESSRSVFLMRNGLPEGKPISKFKSGLRYLIARKNVTREANIYVINTAYPRVDYDRIEAVNNMRRGKWFKMKAFVDELPEYPT